MIRAAVLCGVAAAVLAPGAAGAAERYVVGGTYTTPRVVVGAPLLQGELGVLDRPVRTDPLLTSQEWASGTAVAEAQVERCSGRTSTDVAYGAGGTAAGERLDRAGPAGTRATVVLGEPTSCSEPGPPAGGGEPSTERPGRRCGQAACEPPERRANGRPRR